MLLCYSSSSDGGSPSHRPFVPLPPQKNGNNATNLIRLLSGVNVCIYVSVYNVLIPVLGSWEALDAHLLY